MGLGGRSFAEFAHLWYGLMLDTADEPVVLARAFYFFDKDGNGEVTTEELKATMEELGGMLGPGEIDQFMALTRSEREGVLIYRDFVRALLSQRPKYLPPGQRCSPGGGDGSGEIRSAPSGGYCELQAPLDGLDHRMSGAWARRDGGGDPRLAAGDLRQSGLNTGASSAALSHDRGSLAMVWPEPPEAKGQAGAAEEPPVAVAQAQRSAAREAISSDAAQTSGGETVKVEAAPGESLDPARGSKAMIWPELPGANGQAEAAEASAAAATQGRRSATHAAISSDAAQTSGVEAVKAEAAPETGLGPGGGSLGMIWAELPGASIQEAAAEAAPVASTRGLASEAFRDLRPLGPVSVMTMRRRSAPSEGRSQEGARRPRGVSPPSDA
ncbi:unnamed protein product [Ostreobium quekettii]|uniref:EF-hand domain-containing protein n=1 Tax=Ostreobium quekettii TaxID=121088 RepID=A0A8S1IYN7_9CHLO|nr:unnamed protein product [Ostreobium quekettii]